MSSRTKRIIIGRPLRSDAASHTLLPKWLALPIFCSDPLSSVAYATEQIVLVLVLGGAAALKFTPGVGLAVAALILIVVASYTRTIHAYPNGGGAYAVGKDQFGERVALIAASSLIIDYVLTVAVSVTSGVANFVSAFPQAHPFVLQISIALVIFLTLMNLRGIKESGQAFALPTYLFIGSVLLMIAMGIFRHFTGDKISAPTSDLILQTHQASQSMVLFLILRAFASGCTALTGVEAISNGVPYFKAPKTQNASRTLMTMGALAIVMFLGVTWLAVITNAKIAENPTDLGLAPGSPQQTIIAQLGTAIFGSSSVGFYVLQLATTFVLVLAANTSYNSFPIMASVLGRDGFLPRQLGRRGDRLVYSNGVIILASAAGILIWIYDASVTHLVQLYILGVFLSFTISQAGMVKYWLTRFRQNGYRRTVTDHVSLITNFLGASITAIVLVIVAITKFTHGAWIVVVAIPLLTFIMNGIRSHYEASDIRLAAAPGGVTLPDAVHAVVLISKVNAPSLQALAYARATRPTTLRVIHIVTDEGRANKVKEAWNSRGIDLELEFLDSPYRDITGPTMKFITELRQIHPEDLITVFIPEYVVVHWWEHLLHNQTALRIKRRLLFEPGIVVTNVPLVGTRQTEEQVTKEQVSG